MYNIRSKKVDDESLRAVLEWPFANDDYLTPLGVKLKRFMLRKIYRNLSVWDIFELSMTIGLTWFLTGLGFNYVQYLLWSSR